MLSPVLNSFQLPLFNMGLLSVSPLLLITIFFMCSYFTFHSQNLFKWVLFKIGLRSGQDLAHRLFGKRSLQLHWQHEEQSRNISERSAFLLSILYNTISEGPAYFGAVCSLTIIIDRNHTAWVTPQWKLAHKRCLICKLATSLFASSADLFVSIPVFLLVLLHLDNEYLPL